MKKEPQTQSESVNERESEFSETFPHVIVQSVL